ncbi:MAG: TIGR01244 family phosphatase [Alphaproteobacteria bacterium]|nr:TIGR01244 family phosphatase [Alphaproteobacteria bacterium]
MIANKVTDDISVAPQITVEDVAAIAAAGFRSIVCNRPDGESSGQAAVDDVKAAAEAQGLSFSYQPVLSGRMSIEDVQAFKTLYEAAPKPILAYCRSGTRCAFLWAFSQAGNMATGDILAATAAAGYDLSGMAPALERIGK